MEHHKKRYLLILILILLVLALSVWLRVFSLWPKDYVEVSFLDVGQGDGILIEGRNGNQILIDAGPGPVILRKLGQEISFFDRFLDVVIETHPDKDHIGGFPHVLSRYAVGAYIEPGVESDNSIDDEVSRLVSVRDIASFASRSGGIIHLGDGSYLEILFPDRDVSNFETNDASVIARYVYGETCFLLTGDAPQKMEDYLVSLYGDSLACQVLKVGHHGSNTSTGSLFLAAVRPQYAVISAGIDNPYGHPHKEVISRLTAFGADIHETAKEGTITFRSDGRNILIKK